MNIRKALEKMNEESASSTPTIGTSPSNRVDDQTFFGDTQAVDNSGQFKYFAGIGDNPPVFEYPARYNFQARLPRSRNMRQALRQVAGVEEEMPQMGGGMQQMMQQMMGGGGGPQAKRPFVDTPGQIPAQMDFEMAKKLTGFVDDMKTPETLPGRPQEISQQAAGSTETQMGRPAGHEEIPQSQLVPKYIAGKGRVQVHPEDIRMHYTRRAAVSAIERNNSAIKNLIQFGGGNQDELLLKMVDDNYDLLKHAVGLEDKEPIPAKIRQQLMQGQIPSDDDDDEAGGTDPNAAIADMGMFEEVMGTASVGTSMKKRGGANLSGSGGKGGGSSYYNPFMYAPASPNTTPKRKRKKDPEGYYPDVEGDPPEPPVIPPVNPNNTLTPTAPVEDEPVLTSDPTNVEQEPDRVPQDRGYAAQNTLSTYGGFSRDKPKNWYDDPAAVLEFYNVLVDDFGVEFANMLFELLGIPIPQG